MLSTLQLGLIVLGVAIVVAVLVYNRWQTARLLPRRARTAVASAIDPSLGGIDQSDADHRQEPSLGEGRGADLPAGVPAPAAAGSALLNSQLDTIVPLTPESVVSGDALLAALPGTRRIGSKPFFIEAMHPEGGAWEFPRAGQRYETLKAGIQLANRTGALNEIEFSEFVVKLQAFCDGLHLSADFPDMMVEVGRARELDQFAADHDAQLTFTLRATRAAWSPGYLTQHAAMQGFVVGALPGRMVLPASQPGAAPVLVLQYETQAALSEDPDQAALRQFSISLDVPHVARSERPFVRLREAAIQLSKAMEGLITDDGGQPLNTDAMDRIGADLEVLYDALEQRGLDAGMPLTRRLFS